MAKVRPLRISLALAIGLMAMMVHGEESNESLRVGIVPQQAATRLAALWAPILAEIGRRAEIELEFRTAPDIPAFERRLMAVYSPHWTQSLMVQPGARDRRS